MKHKTPKLLAFASTMIIGIMIGTTTLIVMAHADRWGRIRDELIASPIIVLGFGVALTAFVWAMTMVDQ